MRSQNSVTKNTTRNLIYEGGINNDYFTITKTKEVNFMLNESNHNTDVPIWEKSNLTLKEAASYSGLGINFLRDLTNEPGCKFVLFVGRKRLIKRVMLDKYLESKRELK